MGEGGYLPSSVARWIVGAILKTSSALNTLMRFGGVVEEFAEFGGFYDAENAGGSRGIEEDWRMKREPVWHPLDEVKIEERE